MLAKDSIISVLFIATTSYVFNESKLLVNSFHKEISSKYMQFY